MTLRERIANWVSGGKLSEKEKFIAVQGAEITYLRDSVERHWDMTDKFADALNEIISQEKPTSNSTVKRMARITKGALNG